jgi:hypothetical protein
MIVGFQKLARLVAWRMHIQLFVLPPVSPRINVVSEPIMCAEWSERCPPPHPATSRGTENVRSVKSQFSPYKPPPSITRHQVFVSQKET